MSHYLLSGWSGENTIPLGSFIKQIPLHHQPPKERAADREAGEQRGLCGRFRWAFCVPWGDH